MARTGRQIKNPDSLVPEKDKIADKIMSCLSLGAQITLALLSPFGFYNLFAPGKTHYFYSRSFNKELKRLKSRGYISLTKTSQGWLIRLLKKGKRRWQRVQIEQVKLPRQESWDGKWRFFAFDIPEKQRYGRDLLRKKLKELGMYNMQRSVFVYPFDCRKELDFITETFELDKYTSFVEGVYTDIDKELKNYFKKNKILSKPRT